MDSLHLRAASKHSLGPSHTQPHPSLERSDSGCLPVNQEHWVLHSPGPWGTCISVTWA